MSHAHGSRCEDALAIFVTGLENRPEQMLKWGLRLTLSYTKSHCTDASTAKEKLLLEDICKQKTCAKLPCALGDTLPVDNLSLSRQH